MPNATTGTRARAHLPRDLWKAYYRQLRIARREAMKAVVDAMVFGTGVTTIVDGVIKHVPLADFYVDKCEQDVTT